MSRFISNQNPTDQELGLMALAASPTPEDACEFLKTEHGLRTKPSILKTMSKRFPEQYEELRAKIVPLKEKTLAHNMLDNGLYASEATRIAMDQLVQRLQENRIPPEYLSRVARDIADVQTKSVDKKLALENRPTVITETRSAPEILRKLQDMGVIDASSEDVKELPEKANG